MKKIKSESVKSDIQSNFMKTVKFLCIELFTSIHVLAIVSMSINERIFNVKRKNERLQDEFILKCQWF